MRRSTRRHSAKIRGCWRRAVTRYVIDNPGVRTAEHRIGPDEPTTVRLRQQLASLRREIDERWGEQLWPR
ncbi:hypothetical protein BKA01_004849 [Pseudonocardia eucalypti]|uniref:hypothetical protein n=1 Tax=Pseudonocardia eucalypti TaxID=648755 RepID=UPI00161B10E7|nr:hypothetical protein [Pseudonocardia eucalypti]